MAAGAAISGVLGTMATYWLRGRDQKAKLDAEAEGRIGRTYQQVLADLREDIKNLKEVQLSLVAKLEEVNEQHRLCMEKSIRQDLAIRMLYDHNTAQDAILRDLGYPVKTSPQPPSDPNLPILPGGLT